MKNLEERQKREIEALNQELKDLGKIESPEDAEACIGIMTDIELVTNDPEKYFRILDKEE